MHYETELKMVELSLGKRVVTGMEEQIRERLFQLKELEYKAFQSGLIPTMDKRFMIGVRTVHLKKIAAQLAKKENYREFLTNLPHLYFEENQIHAFLIAGIKSMDECVKEVNIFLPYVDNWATCDQLNPKIFRFHKKELLEEVKGWIRGREEYKVRFAIKMLMDHFLGDDFLEEYPKLVSGIVREEYYIRMMAAWYFATALAKQYDRILPYFTEGKLEKWVHNKALQKALESSRISEEKKEYLKTLKRRSLAK